MFQGGISVRFDGSRVQTYGLSEVPQRSGRKVRNVSWQFEAIPIGLEYPSFARIYIRDKYIKNSTRFQPLGDSSHHLPRFINMFEHVETSHHIKSFRWKSGIKYSPYENFSAASFLRLSGLSFRHLDRRELPTVPVERFEKCPGAAAEVQECTLLLVLRNGAPPALPSVRRSLAGLANEPVVIGTIMLAHFRRCRRVVKPYQRTRGATHQLIGFLQPMKPVRYLKPLP